MTRPRFIPLLLLQGTGLVKTVRFRKPSYLGDPINIIKIFNDKEVDELFLLDIGATPQRRGPNLRYLADVVSEAFVPLAYGGGISTIEEMHELFRLGIEKVVLNTGAAEDPLLVRRAADAFGSQAVVVCIDARPRLLGGYRVWKRGGRQRTSYDPVSFAVMMREAGAGELVVQAIHRDGTWRGYDLPLIKAVASAVDVPVVAAGGAGSVEDLKLAVGWGGASAAAAGSLFVYQRTHRAVLVSFPARAELDAVAGPAAGAGSRA